MIAALRNCTPNKATLSLYIHIHNNNILGLNDKPDNTGLLLNIHNETPYTKILCISQPTH